MAGAGVRAGLICLLMSVVNVSSAGAQENLLVGQMRDAYAALDYATAIRRAQQAIRQDISPPELIETYELLGFMYGALDSTVLARQAFRNLILLDPNREPDPLLVSPDIRSQYNTALGFVFSGSALLTLLLSRILLTRIAGGKHVDGLIETGIVDHQGFSGQRPRIRMSQNFQTMLRTLYAVAVEHLYSESGQQRRALRLQSFD